MKDYNLIKENDPALYEAISMERERQRNKIELIASENFVSETVMEANSSFARSMAMLSTVSTCSHPP